MPAAARRELRPCATRATSGFLRGSPPPTTKMTGAAGADGLLCVGARLSRTATPVTILRCSWISSRAPSRAEVYLELARNKSKLRNHPKQVK